MTLRDRRAHRLGDDVGGDASAGGRGWPRPRRSRARTTRSPSWRVCDGCIERARPWCALSASRWHSTFVQRASVATTTSVVFAPRGPPRTAPVRETRRVGRRGRAGEDAAVGADDVADRVHDRERADDHVAVARGRRAEPPGTACSPPRHLPTVAPRPAPTRPVATGGGGRGPRRPARRGPPPGRAVPPDVTRSKIAAAGTIGHRPAAGREPPPVLGERVHHAVGRRETERGAAATARPRRRARRCAPGSSSAISRVAGAPPRTSPEPTVPGGSSTTVTPVPSPVQCPTRTPGTSEITARRRGPAPRARPRERSRRSARRARRRVRA